MSMDHTKTESGPKYLVNIEGKDFPWSSPTITPEEIAKLGGWDPSLGVIEIDLQTNVEHQLAPRQPVELKPGQGFAKKVRFKRG
jgi:hypothetical protein